MQSELATKISPQEMNAWFEKGITTSEYREQFQAKAERLKENPALEGYDAFVPINYQRWSRVERTIAVSESLKHTIDSMGTPVRWIILAEFWCGDAAQNGSILAKIADESNGKIELRFLFRDENLELMDEFLTNGGRAIPKLIQLDAAGNVLSTWGARPAEATALVKQLKSNPETAASYADELHKWYAKNRQEALQAEIMQLLAN